LAFYAAINPLTIGPVHSHNHSRAWTGTVPAYDLKNFWGALGCSCFAF
jgi:hypothetical protein